MFSGFKKSVVALLLGIVGLCAGPVGAQKPPRLLFLGISKDGRPSLTAENAVQLRLGGLDVSVVRSKELTPCEQADCLSAALAVENADLALTGRVLKNEHACVATLWLAAINKHEKPTEHDIACRSDGDISELIASIADGAAVMVDEYIRDKELDSAPNGQKNPFSAFEKNESSIPEKNQNINKKQKLIIGLSLLLTGSLAATIALASMKPPNDCLDKPGFVCINPLYGIGIGAFGTLTGSLACSIGFLGKK